MYQRKNKQSISLTLDVEIVHGLRAYAEQEERSISQCANRLLRAQLGLYEKNRPMENQAPERSKARPGDRQEGQATVCGEDVNL